jgi:hypothetical protein
MLTHEHRAESDKADMRLAIYTQINDEIRSTKFKFSVKRHADAKIITGKSGSHLNPSVPS